jgi:hypothetical protein
MGECEQNRYFIALDHPGTPRRVRMPPAQPRLCRHAPLLRPLRPRLGQAGPPRGGGAWRRRSCGRPRSPRSTAAGARKPDPSLAASPAGPTRWTRTAASPGATASAGTTSTSAAARRLRLRARARLPQRRLRGRGDRARVSPPGRPRPSDAERAEALKYLVHYVGRRAPAVARHADARQGRAGLPGVLARPGHEPAHGVGRAHARARARIRRGDEAGYLRDCRHAPPLPPDRRGSAARRWTGRRRAAASCATGDLSRLAQARRRVPRRAPRADGRTAAPRRRAPGRHAQPALDPREPR